MTTRPRIGWILTRVLVITVPFLAGAVTSLVLAVQTGERTGSEDLDAGLTTASWDFVAERLEGADLTVALLPDTQYYTVFFPEVFEAQTRWIAARDDIDYVIHLGDVVENHGRVVKEWERAADAMALLDVPYGAIVGNHDMAPDGSTAMFDHLAPTAHRVGKTSWQIVSGRLFMMLAYCPDDEAVEVAADVIVAHDGPVVLATHAFLLESNSRASCISDFSDGDNTAADLWRRLVVPHGNLRLVLSGHEHPDGGAASRTDVVDGRHVHQLLSNYQEMGDSGYLRIMAWHGCRLEVVTYSPTRDHALLGAGNMLSLPVCS